MYPLIKKSFAFAMALLATLAVTAQHNELAVSAAYISPTDDAPKKNVIEKVVKIKYRNQNKVTVYWTPAKGAVSHYVLERSINNRSFYEAGLLFTSDEDDASEYFFTDNLHVTYGGALYYRLRVVGMDGSEVISPVSTVNPVGGASVHTR